MVRPPASHDADTLRSLLHDDGGFSERVEGRRASEQELAELLEPPVVLGHRPTTLVAFAGGQAVAVASVLSGWPEPQCTHVGLLQVRASLTGLGNGRRMHDEVVDLACRHGSTWMRLTVVEPNLEHARGFWESLGYHLTGEVRPWENGDGETLDAHVMRRDVY